MPAPVAGTMGEQLVAEGDTVAVGAVIARIEDGNGAAAAPRRRAGRDAGQPGRRRREYRAARGAEADAPRPSEDEDRGGLTLSPAVRRVVLEHHLDPSKIKGTGKDGRLTKDDVLAAAKAQKAAAGARARTRTGARRRASPPPPRPAQPPASAARNGCG